MQIEFLHERARAQIGQKLDATSAIVVSSHSLQTIPFGALVVYDEADPLLCTLPQANKPITKALGISLRHHYGEDYQPKTSIAMLRQGRVWVLADKVLAPGDGVYLHFDDKGTAKFTGDSKDNLQLKNAIFLDKCDNGLVPLEIDFIGGYYELYASSGVFKRTAQSYFKPGLSRILSCLKGTEFYSG